MPTSPLGDLEPFAGSWSGSGEGHYPTIDDFAYAERIDFTAPPGKPFLTYLSRTWSPDRSKAMHTENGYLRRTEDGVELLVSQPTGFVEIHRGAIRDGQLELSMLSLSPSPEAKPVHEIRRRFVVEGDTLRYDLWMSHAQTPLTHHLSAVLRRSE